MISMLSFYWFLENAEARWARERFFQSWLGLRMQVDGGLHYVGSLGSV